jgi:hypothetical protein
VGRKKVETQTDSEKKKKHCHKKNTKKRLWRGKERERCESAARNRVVMSIEEGCNTVGGGVPTALAASIVL